MYTYFHHIIDFKFGVENVIIFSGKNGSTIWRSWLEKRYSHEKELFFGDLLQLREVKAGDDGDDDNNYDDNGDDDGNDDDVMKWSFSVEIFTALKSGYQQFLLGTVQRLGNRFW